MGRMLLAGVLAATTVFSLAACAPPGTPTLTASGNGLAACLPDDTDDGFVELTLRNTGPDPIVVSGVSINPVMGAQLADSWLVATGGTASGSSDDGDTDGGNTDGGNTDRVDFFGGRFPPETSPAWDARVDAVGTAIPRGSSVLLALHVTRAAGVEGAAVNGASVSYTGSRGESLLATSGFYFAFDTPADGTCTAPE